MDLDKYFKKAELIPAIVTDIDTGGSAYARIYEQGEP